jgi:hypothetical protein
MAKTRIDIKDELIREAQRILADRAAGPILDLVGRDFIAIVPGQKMALRS